MIGKTFGHYRIEEKLGQGGMGEVYRATDSKLGRNVALKLLPEAFARDPERLARFQREAQLLASLNHPHIAAIHGLENVSGIHALVLELVGGPTLGERIREGPMSLAEALPIAHQMAQALEAAHEQGVIHRDLKPENVKLTPDGRVKVLDFGLAKALEPPGTPSGDLTHSPTLSPAITGAMTAANVILGTAGYMSPEQARGQAVDKRADIWAFGVVLFEMLTGRRLFTGETVSDTLAAVLRLDPDWKSIPDGTPLRIKSLLRRCLERDPKKRLRDIGDARLTLEEAMAGAPEEEAPKTLLVAAPPDPRRRVLAGVAMLGVTAVAFAAGWLGKPAAEDRRVRMFELPVADLSSSLSQGNTAPSLDPEGRRIAYVSDDGLWVRDLARLDPQRIPGTDGATTPFWSPDGEWIGYGSQRKLWKVRASGGEPIALCDLSDGFSAAGGGAWGTDGRIVFCHGDGPLLSVSEQGGDPDTVLVPDPETEDDFHHVTALPDGRGLLFVVHAKGQHFSSIDVLANGKRKQLVNHEDQDVTFPDYSPSGHLVYHREPVSAGLWAVPFSLAKLEVTGEPVLAIPDVTLGTVSYDGTLVYAQGGVTQRGQLAFCDRTGRVERTVGDPQDLQSFFALSPDGRRAAIRTNGEDSDLWIVDTERETQTRFTFGDSRESWPLWSRDGALLYFQDNLGQACTTLVKAADGTGEVDTLVAGGYGGLAPDGKTLLFTRFNADLSSFDLWMVPLGADGRTAGEATMFLASNTINWSPRISPDGRFVAYCSQESGSNEIYLKRFPSGEGKWQVTTDEGYWPRWRADGKELFFATDDGVFSVSVELGNAPVLGKPTLLFARPGKIGTLPFNWPDAFDVAGDGQRFLILIPAESKRSERVPALVVVENWASTLGAKK